MNLSQLFTNDNDDKLFQHAQALEYLSEHLKDGSTCLDVGSGSGYLAACMALMVFIYFILSLMKSIFRTLYD